MNVTEQMLVYMNGEMRSAKESNISVFDSGFTAGDLVLEVFRTFNHKPYHMDLHMERLFNGIREIQIEVNMTPKKLTDIALHGLYLNMEKRADDIDWQFIIYVTKGLDSAFEIFDTSEIKPALVITYLPLCRRIGQMVEKYEKGIDLVVVTQRIIPSSILSPQIKSRGRLDYKIARLQAKAIKSGSTGIMCDSEGNVMEGSGTNIFFVREGILLTPPSNEVVNGVTRQAIIKIAHYLGIKVVERLVPLNEAMQADEIFLTSTIIGIEYAKSFEGKILSSGQSGSATCRIRKAFEEEVGINLLDQARKYQQIITEKQ